MNGPIRATKSNCLQTRSRKRGVSQTASACQILDHDEAVDQKRVAVARVLLGELRQPDGAAGARHVLDRHLLDDAAALHHFLQRPRGLVPAAAGIGRRDDLQLVERQRRAAGQGEAEHGRRERSAEAV